MAGRILECRKLLHDKLRELGTPGSWKHIEDQKGMFGFTGLNGEEFSTLVFKQLLSEVILYQACHVHMPGGMCA